MKISNGMKLIIGLGNPGKKYEKNRHNAAFRILDELAQNFGTKFSKNEKLKSEIAEVHLDGKKIILSKPQTFMNESGLAAGLLIKFFKIKLSDLFIIHDDVDLYLGTTKFYEGGGSAGHKGVESIIQALGNGFTRLRVGIENRKEFRIPPTDDYVLQNFTPKEEKQLETEVIPKAIEQIKKWLAGSHL